jgi:hypothetical protein
LHEQRQTLQAVEAPLHTSSLDRQVRFAGGVQELLPPQLAAFRGVGPV